MTLRVRLEGDALAAWSFIVKEEYPPIVSWDAGVLAEQAIMIRIEEVKPDDIVTAGYVWALWHDDFPFTLNYHVCIAPSYRTRWFKVLPDLYQIALYLGARAVSTKTHGDRASRLVRELLVRRLGYVAMPDGTLFRTLEETDGLSTAKEAEASDADTQADRSHGR